MAVQKAPKAPVGAVFITVMFVLGPLRGVATAAVDAWVGAAAWVGGAELVGAHATISAKVSAANGATQLRSITLDKPTTLRLWWPNSTSESRWPNAKPSWAASASTPARSRARLCAKLRCTRRLSPAWLARRVLHSQSAHHDC